MIEIVIDKKKYVLISEKEYQALQRQAASKTKPENYLMLNMSVNIARRCQGNWKQKSNC